MSRIATPASIQTSPAASQPLLQAVKKQLGVVPNLFRVVASINDLPIFATDRKFHWPLGRRPDNHPGLSELGL